MELARLMRQKLSEGRHVWLETSAGIVRYDFRRLLGLKPHPESNHPKLNDHTDRVACATCHIPTFARGGSCSSTHS